MFNWQEEKKQISSLLEQRIENFSSRLSKLRSNQLSPEIVRNLPLTWQEEKKTVKSFCSIVVSGSQLIIRPFNSNSQLLNKIVDLIIAEELGLKVDRHDKNEAFFSLAPLTEEARNRVIKMVKSLTEEEKIQLRNFRHEKRNNLKKNPQLSDDQKKKYESELDVLVKKQNDKLELLESTKSESLKSI